MTPTDDKPMTVDALMELALEYAMDCDGEHDTKGRLRAAIEQYGKEQYARGVNDVWPAGRGSGEPVATIVECEPVEKDDDVAHGRPIVDRAIDWYADDIAHLPVGALLYAAPQPREPLTDEQIDRHTLLAQECPPGSKVILVSSLRRLRVHDIRSAG